MQINWIFLHTYYIVCRRFGAHLLRWGNENGNKAQKWYFVTKIVLTYCEKKLFKRDMILPITFFSNTGDNFFHFQFKIRALSFNQLLKQIGAP